MDIPLDLATKLLDEDDESRATAMDMLADIRTHVLGYAALWLVNDDSEGDSEQMSEALAWIVTLSHELAKEREAALGL